MDRGRDAGHMPGHRVRRVGIVSKAEDGTSVSAELRWIEGQQDRPVHADSGRIGTRLAQCEVESVHLLQELAVGSARTCAFVDLGLHLIGSVSKLLQHAMIRRVPIGGWYALGVADVLRM